MKDYNQIADRVFRRRDEYLEEKKRKKAIFIRRTAIALSCCLIALVGFGIWRMDPFKSVSPHPEDGPYNVTAATASTAIETTAAIITDTAEVTTYTDITDTTAADTTAADIKTTSATVSTAAAGTTRITTKPSGSGTVGSVRTTASHMEVTAPQRTTTAKNDGEQSGEPLTTASRTGTSPRTTTSHRTTATTYRTSTTTRRTTTRPVYTTTTTRPAYTTTTTAYTWPVFTATTYAATTVYIPPAFTTAAGNATRPVSSTTGSPRITTTASVGVSEDAPCASFVYNDTTYTLVQAGRNDLSVSGSDDELYSGSMYSDTTGRFMTYRVYRHKNFDPRFICKVTFSGTDKVYLGMNRDFIPDDLSDFLSATDFRNSILVTRAIDYESDNSSEDVDKTSLVDILRSHGDAASEEGNSEFSSKAILLYEIENVRSMSGSKLTGTLIFTKNGKFRVYMGDRVFFFDVGEEEVKNIYRRLT